MCDESNWIVVRFFKGISGIILIPLCSITFVGFILRWDWFILHFIRFFFLEIREIAFRENLDDTISAMKLDMCRDTKFRREFYLMHCFDDSMSGFVVLVWYCWCWSLERIYIGENRAIPTVQYWLKLFLLLFTRYSLFFLVNEWM